MYKKSINKIKYKPHDGRVHRIETQMGEFTEQKLKQSINMMFKLTSYWGNVN